MPTFNIEDAAFSGLGLLTRRPGAAIAWALVWAALVALVAIPFAGALAAYVTLVAKTGGHFSPFELVPIAPQLGAFGLLMGLGGLVVGAVVSCAVYRAVLEPESSGFAYLRLGDQEIQVMLVNFVRGLILFIINFVISITVAMLVILAGDIATLATAIRVLGELILIGVVFWVQLRFSLAGPMTYVDHRFRLFESWTLTKGLIGRLLAVGAILMVIGVVVYLAVVSLAIAGCLALWNNAPRPGDVQALLTLPPAQWLAALAPFIALIAGMVVLAAAILTPIGLAPWPQIYRTLNGEGSSAST